MTSVDGPERPASEANADTQTGQASKDSQTASEYVAILLTNMLQARLYTAID